MTHITDVRTTGAIEHWGAYGTFKTAGAVTRGNVVAINSSGNITAVATATLNMVIGVAAESAASGGTCNVLLMGYCDYLVTADTITAPSVDDATDDYFLIAVDGGGVAGRSATELGGVADLEGAQIVGRNLAANSTTTAYGWITAGACMTVGPGA
jgi:hypothetical protein